MRLVEIRLLDGPNVFALEPTVKVEVAVGRQRRWSGDRVPPGGAIARLGADLPARAWPDEVAALVAWVRRLRADAGEGPAGVRVHRPSDPGHWVVAWPWSGAERARAIAEAAVALVDRGVSSARRVRLTGAQERLLARRQATIQAARSSPPAWYRDEARRVPVVSVSGTNGKSTVTRLVSHVLLLAGWHVGTTTSDGVYVDERLIDAGDWTGPGGAGQVLGRGDVDVAVLETARGGILLRGVGYQSNEVSVLTNVSPDHLDLQGIHTLPELAEVKATICRITRPTGRVVLNADDPFVLAAGRRVAAPLALFTLGPGRAAAFRRHLHAGYTGYAVRDGALVELEGEAERPIVAARDVPITLGGIARYNVANALAAAAAARGIGATLDEVAHGLSDFRPTAAMSPGRLNLFRLGQALVIVDFAHNEAGVEAVLRVAEELAAGGAGHASAGAGHAAAVTAIVGTAGDRPDDTLRAIGRVGAQHAQRVAIKETPRYLRGRSREHVVAELLAGVAAGGGDPASVPVYESETAALRAELAGPSAATDRRPGPNVIVLLCHEEREAVLSLLLELGAHPIDVATDLAALVPRLQERPGDGA